MKKTTILGQEREKKNRSHLGKPKWPRAVNNKSPGTSLNKMVPCLCHLLLLLHCSPLLKSVDFVIDSSDLFEQCMGIKVTGGMKRLRTADLNSFLKNRARRKNESSRREKMAVYGSPFFLEKKKGEVSTQKIYLEGGVGKVPHQAEPEKSMTKNGRQSI